MSICPTPMAAGAEFTPESYQLAQMRIAQLELENKMLKDQIQLYQRQFGGGAPQNPPTAAKENVPAAEGNKVPEKKASAFGASMDSLNEMKDKMVVERDQASKKFISLLEQYQKILDTNIDVDEIMSRDDSFSTRTRTPTPIQESDLDMM